MITKKLFTTYNQIEEIQRMAQHCPFDVAFHNEDNTVAIDAKSRLGIYTLNFKEPIMVVSENEAFHKRIEHIGRNVA